MPEQSMVAAPGACGSSVREDALPQPSSCRAAALLLGLALPVLALTGCQPRAQAPAQVSPPPGVAAVEAQTRPVEEELELVGRVVAKDRVELRARVEGFLEARTFTEGQPVAAGDLLFQIEPDQYRSVVQQREADVEKTKADAQNAEAQLARGQELLKANNIARAKVDELKAAAAVAKASIAQAEAALAAANLSLGYTGITAPIAGRIGLAAVTVGNLVGPSSGVLATIVSRDPIYLQFPATQRQLLEARRKVHAKGGDPREVVVQARLPDGTLYDHSGHLDFVDVTTDPTTDSVTLRAELPNPDGLLVDGQYIGVVLQSGEPEPVVVIPQSALQIDQQGVFVLVVDADSQAQVRRIETGAVQGADIAVTKGLEPGDLVITQGVQKVRPGQEVRVAPAAGAGEGEAQ